ncbi:hypothetical protein SprV_0200753100 [Sparganum proliferum]
MGRFAVACDNFGLIINAEKTVTMHQPPPDTVYVAPKINVNGAKLQAVNNFTCIGNTFSRSNKIDDEMVRRIFKANHAFGRLRNTV